MSSRSVSRVWAVVTVVAFASAAGRVRAAEGEPVEAARQVFEKHQAAVVSVSAVVKMRMVGAGAAQLGGMGKQEQKTEAVGTVIHESGLTVLSYMTLDPSAMMNEAFKNANMAGAGIGKIEYKSELSDVKIRLADGTELPAKLVLKDPDLDLAFVRPIEEKKGLPFVGMDKGAAPKLLDPVIGLNRMGQSLDRQAGVQLQRVSAVVTKPRTFYVCGMLLSLGTPVFAADGTPVGVSVMRTGNFRAQMGVGGITDALTFVVLPAADVAEAAQQALTRKADAGDEDARETGAEPARPEAGDAGEKTQPKEDEGL